MNQNFDVLILDLSCVQEQVVCILLWLLAYGFFPSPAIWKHSHKEQGGLWLRPLFLAYLSDFQSQSVPPVGLESSVLVYSLI